MTFFIREVGGRATSAKDSPVIVAVF